MELKDYPLAKPTIEDISLISYFSLFKFIITAFSLIDVQFEHLGQSR